MPPYRALDVIETFSRIDGRRYWVRDEEEAHLWSLVEYVDRRLVCWCPDGEARTESPGTEPECVHLRAVVELVTATSPRTPAPIVASAWVD